MKVTFAGWNSDTYTLQQSGWELSTRENPMSNTFCIAMKHPHAGVIFISKEIGLYYSEYFHTGRVECISPKVEVNHVIHQETRIMLPYPSFEGFAPIDAKPQIVEFGRELKYEDISIFSKQLVRTEELVVDPSEISKYLELIKNAQAPKQKEIRNKGYRDVNPGVNFHAQIVSFKAA